MFTRFELYVRMLNQGQVRRFVLFYLAMIGVSLCSGLFIIFVRDLTRDRAQHICMPALFIRREPRPLRYLQKRPGAGV